MADETATFAVKLEDETSGAANAAANSLESLKTKINEDVRALREMQKAMRNLKGGTSTSKKAFDELKDKVAAQKASIQSAQAKYVELGGTFGKTAPKIKQAAASTDQLSGAMLGAGGPLGSLSGGLAKLGPLLANPITLAIALSAAMIRGVGLKNCRPFLVKLHYIEFWVTSYNRGRWPLKQFLLKTFAMENKTFYGYLISYVVRTMVGEWVYQIAVLFWQSCITLNFG